VENNYKESKQKKQTQEIQSTQKIGLDDRVTQSIIELDVLKQSKTTLNLCIDVMEH